MYQPGTMAAATSEADARHWGGVAEVSSQVLRFFRPATPAEREAAANGRC